MSLTDETRRILELLRHHHSGVDGWATFVELAEEPVGGQRLDFFALHTWRSKGYRAVAYEIKVSRGDFKRELEQPQKRVYAETIAHECLFVVPRGLVLADEIPDGWGLMVADAGGLKLLKHGTQRKDVKWTAAFVASMARRAADPAPTLPRAAWKVEGREVNEAELITIAETTLKVTLEHSRATEREAGKRELMQGDEYKKLVALRNAVAKATGLHNYWLNADTFQEWYTKTFQEGMPPDARDKIARATELLRQAIGANP